MDNKQNVSVSAAFQSKNYAFINHRACEAFPCHSTTDIESFNCLFCYCPLYFTGESCGGAFTYTAKGVKDCSSCTFPHDRANYDLVVERLINEIEARQKTDS